MEHIHNIIVGVLAISFYELIKWVSRHRRMPYRWKCPRCNFKIESSTRDVYEISKSSHNHISTEEYK